MVTLAEVLRFAMRLTHTGGAAVWIGCGLLYFLARSAQGTVTGGYYNTLRLLMARSLVLLVGSGVYLIFDRLSNPQVGLTYVVVLAIKLIMTAGIVWLVSGGRQVGRQARSTMAGPRPWWRDRGRLVLALGAGALALGVALTLIYEAETGRI